MTRIEFYTAYRLARYTERDFREYMSRANLPCGTDDMMYENFYNSQDEFFSNNPAVAYAMRNKYEQTREEMRQQHLNDFYFEIDQYRFNWLKNHLGVA